ncbi:HIRA-interacting protein 3-like [Macrobrachium nipponense]|uniref:HIRA-interacting protein 3-like n=1 Tax=Macrobrachium nipponense TaxID=159736 RepID=UPI0030C81898
MDEPLSKNRVRPTLKKKSKGNPYDSDSAMDEFCQRTKAKGKTNIKKGKEDPDDSDSEMDEPLSKTKGKTNIKKGKKDSDDSDSEMDEPLSKTKGKTNIKKGKKDDDSDSERETLSKTKGKTNIKKGKKDSDDSDSEMDEPLSKTKGKTNIKKGKKDSDDSDSEMDEPLSKTKGKTNIKKGKEDSDDSDSEMDEPLSKTKAKTNIKKREKDSDDSDNKTKKALLKTKRKSSTKKGKEKLSSGTSSPVKSNAPVSSSDLSSCSDDEKSPKGNTKDTEMPKKIKSGDRRILKKKAYIKKCGIRIKSYDLLFEGCKTIAAKERKLLSILQEHGMEGRPTLKKCEEIREKLEREKELAELDMSNIITESGRGRRNAFSVYATKTERTAVDDFFERPIKASRARHIAESESESDNES